MTLHSFQWIPGKNGRNETIHSSLVFVFAIYAPGYNNFSKYNATTWYLGTITENNLINLSFSTIGQGPDLTVGQMWPFFGPYWW